MKRMKEIKEIKEIKKLIKIKMIKQVWLHIKYFFYAMLTMIITSPVWADLPTPPAEDQMDSSKDWIDVGGAMFYRTLKIVCISLGVLIFAMAAANIVKAYHTAQDRQDLGHFFKMLIVGLVAAAVGIGLVYGGYSIIPSQ